MRCMLPMLYCRDSSMNATAVAMKNSPAQKSLRCTNSHFETAAAAGPSPP